MNLSLIFHKILRSPVYMVAFIVVIISCVLILTSCGGDDVSGSNDGDDVSDFYWDTVTDDQTLESFRCIFVKDGYNNNYDYRLTWCYTP